MYKTNYNLKYSYNMLWCQHVTCLNILNKPDSIIPRTKKNVHMIILPYLQNGQLATQTPWYCKVK